MMVNHWKTVIIFSSFCLLAKAGRSSKNLQNKTEISDKGQLVFAYIIFRHGDRNPLISFPNDPWKKRSNWPGGYNKLTKVGMQQQFELGQYLRRRYASLLGDGHYSDDIVYVQSTGISRTIKSAAVNMAGLFPPQGDQIWNKDLLWQPVPIHIIPRELEYLSYSRKHCPLYVRAMKRYKKSAKFTALLAKYRKLFNYLQKNSGKKIKQFKDVKKLYDTLWIQKLRNMVLPVWANDLIVNNSDFEKAGYSSLQLATNTSVLARLNTGFLLREILNYFEQKIDATLIPNRSLCIYSAHDTTLANILNSLRMFDLHNPPYASSLHFELYKLNDEYYMQIVYRNTTDENPLPLEIPLCGAKCSLEKFKKIYSAIIPTGTFEEECQLPHTKLSEEDDFSVSHIWLIVMISVLGLIPILALYAWKLLPRNQGNIVMENDNLEYL